MYMDRIMNFNERISMHAKIIFCMFIFVAFFILMGTMSVYAGGFDNDDDIQDVKIRTRENMFDYSLCMFVPDNSYAAIKYLIINN